jgi:hypothetical protein
MESQQKNASIGNRVIGLIREAAARNWCVRPFCTTCGSMDFRRALEEIPDLTSELVSLDIGELYRLPDGEDGLAVIMLTQRVDWDQVLEAWIPRIGENARMADIVLFRVIGSRTPFQRSQVMKDWIESCIRLVVQTWDTSLIESLVYVLGVHGEGLSRYPTLLAVAREVGEVDTRVRRALVKAGLMRPSDEFRHECKVAQDAARATKSIFSAIRSNDIKGVTASLKKKPDLAARNQDGLTALEFAHKLGRLEIVSLLGGTRHPDIMTNPADNPSA